MCALLNVDGLRNKAHFVDDTVVQLATGTRGRVDVVVLVETKLAPGIDVVLPGYYCAARRDGGRHNGGGVAIFVADDVAAYATWTAGPGTVEGVEIALLGANGAPACRVLGIYRPRGLEAFDAIDARAAESRSAGTPFLALGDLNVPGFDAGARHGPWARAPKERPQTTAESRRLATTLAAAGLTIGSGLIRWNGTSPSGALSHFKPGTRPSELDFAVLDACAAARVCDGGTENGTGMFPNPSWGFSHHRPVWVALDLAIAPQPPPAKPEYPRAKWSSADAVTRDAYEDELDHRLRPLVAELEANGLRRWRGNTQAALRDIIAEIHSVQGRIVGLAGEARRFRPTPAWWTADAESAAGRLADAASDLAHAGTRDDAAGAALAARRLRTARGEYERRVAADQASFFEWRLACARDDPGALKAVYAELRAHLGHGRLRGGRGTAHEWRALTTTDGRLVSGHAVAPELADLVEDTFRYDTGDPLFCAETARRLEEKIERVRKGLDTECAADWPGGEPVTPHEIATKRASAKRCKVAHPSDGVVPEALIYGGEMLDRALAVVYSAIVATGQVPADARTGAMRCVYKRGDVTRFTNHRGVVLTSHITKNLERVLLRRVLDVAEVDEWQAVANPGVDGRVQIHALYDACVAYRAAAAPDAPVWVMTIDITRGFPSTSRALATEALRTAGVRGRLLRAVMGLIFGTSVVVGVRPGVETRSVPLGVGLLEGAVLSPAIFAFVTGDLLGALRASGRGISVGAVWCGALMFMDDLVLLARSKTELHAMAAVVFDWAYRARYVLALKEKSHVLRLGGTGAAAPTRLTWAPSRASDASRAAAAIDVTFKAESTVAYLGFLLSATDGPDAHIGRQLALARETVERMEAEYGGRALVTFGQAMQLWTLHGRVHLEWPAAVLPPPRAAWDDRISAYDDLQFRALRAHLGPYAHRPAYRMLLAVFGLWRVDERRLMARAQYAFALAQSQRRPRRAELGAEFRRLDVTDDDFADKSVTGEIAAALSRLGYDEWPRCETDAADRDGSIDGVESDDEPADDAECTLGDEPADAVAGTPRGRWDADVRRRCRDIVLGREYALLETTPSGTLKLKSAALWREIAGGITTETRRRALRQWLRRCVLNLTADEAGTAAVGLIAGCWWAAPTSRVCDARGVYVPATCAACGATSRDLPTHLVLGVVAGEAPCTCPIAASCRSEWASAVHDAYAAYADVAAATALTTAPLPSTRRTALMLGFAADVALPWALASRLPAIFARTWGSWSKTAWDAAAAAQTLGPSRRYHDARPVSP